MAADKIHAITLAGGSAFGLEVSSGVKRYLEMYMTGRTGSRLRGFPAVKNMR